MKSNVNGFEVGVTVAEGRPRVRVSLANGEVVIHTDKLSVTGLENMAGVFERAAQMASAELNRHRQQQQTALGRVVR